MVIAFLTATAADRAAAIAALIGLAYLARTARRWRWSAIPDAGMLALYCWRPSVGTLALFFFVLAARHVPAFARTIDETFELDRFDGWTARFIVYILPALGDMSSADEGPTESPSVVAEESQQTTTAATSNNAIATPTTDNNVLLLRAKAQALAKLVHAGKVGETEGIKLVFGVSPSSSNMKYQAARSALKIELAKLANPYPNMTPEQKKVREVLDL